MNQTQSFGWRTKGALAILAAGLLGISIFLLACQRTPLVKDPPEADAVLRAMLDNGLKLVVVPNRLAPVATAVINYIVGSNEASSDFPGTAHALEHMMFRGSEGLSADQLANITAAMGGDFDADTQQVVTQYFFTVPAEDLDVTLHIEAIRMQNILSTTELWDEERRAIDQEVAQDLSSPQYVFFTRLLSAMFHGTPYAHDALGSRESFAKTSGEQLKDFHNTWYVPNNAILVIAGDVQPQKVLAEVKELFGGIPRKDLPQRPEVQLSPVKPETMNLTTDLSYGLAVVAFRMPGLASGDYAASNVLSDVLSSERGKLYELVPQGKALAAGFSLNSLPKAGIGFAYAAYPKGGDGQALVGEIRSILSQEMSGGVPPDLVEAAKRQDVASAEFQKNSVSGLAMAWSEALAVDGKESPEALVNEFQKVSVDDVNRVLRQQLDMDHSIVAVLTPQSSGNPTSSQGFGGKESFAPKQTKPAQLPAWAEGALQRLNVPRSMVDPVVTTLSNGIRLMVQPETISRTVTLIGHIKENSFLETPPGQEGVDEVLGQLFSYGTTSLDRIGYQKALDDIAAQESAGTDFSVQVLTDHLDRGVQLLADNELHPRLPEDAFQIVQQQTAASVAGRLESPDYLASRSLYKALLPATDPTLRETTPKTVSSLKMENVKDYFGHVFRPDLTTIVVIGQITPQKAKEVVGKYFGGWSASGAKPETDLPAVPPNKAASVGVPNKSRVQDKVTLAMALGLTRTNPDYYPLQLGNHVLGGGFYATRLYRDLREKGGLVYSVSSNFEAGKNRGFYLADYACDPPNVSKARTILERNLEDMQNKPVSSDELRRAQAQLLREIPLSESSVSSIAGGLVSRASQDLPLDEPIRAAHRYLDTSAEQVRAAFAKWLRVNDLVQVVEGPPANNSKLSATASHDQAKSVY